MNQPVYFAPLEGVTDAVFRRAHSELFPGVTKYFLPFISPTQNLCFTPRERANIAPEHNEGLCAVPQVLTKNASHFLWAAGEFAAMGYREVNLNAGCPSGTVTAKGKGSGMLTDLDALRVFLDEVYEKSPLPVSIKTRIGFTSADEFDAILALYSRYPVHELTIHPRTRAQQYKGTPYRDVFAASFGRTPLALCCNGDLFTAQDCRALTAQCPDTRALMLGRGLIANPALARELAGGDALTLPELRAFHDRLMADYLARYPAHVVLGRMRQILGYMVPCFEDVRKVQKALRKAQNLRGYHAAAQDLFERHVLRDAPGYVPD